MEFQQRLYELRKQSGLSQEGLADLLGVSRQAVQKWEAGTSRPDLDNLAALGRYFNVSLDYLVTGQEAQVSPSQVTTTIVNNYYTPFHYEYKSKRTLFGLPLVHIRLGHRGMGVAKGILAIGNVAVGVFTLGGFSFGLLSVGGLSFGLLFSLGGWAIGGSGHRRIGGGSFSPSAARQLDCSPMGGGGLWCVRCGRRSYRLGNCHWRFGSRSPGHRSDGGRGIDLWPRCRPGSRGCRHSGSRPWGTQVYPEHSDLPGAELVTKRGRGIHPVLVLFFYRRNQAFMVSVT